MLTKYCLKYFPILSLSHNINQLNKTAKTLSKKPFLQFNKVELTEFLN